MRKNIGGGIAVPFLTDLTTVVLVVVSLVMWFRDGRTKKGERGLLPLTCIRLAGKYDPSSFVLRIFMFRIILSSLRLKRTYNGYIY